MTHEDEKGIMGNIIMAQADFDLMDFTDKKQLLIQTYPELEFDDMSEDEFNEYFDIYNDTKREIRNNN